MRIDRPRCDVKKLPGKIAGVVAPLATLLKISTANRTARMMPTTSRVIFAQLYGRCPRIWPVRPLTMTLYDWFW